MDDDGLIDEISRLLPEIGRLMHAGLLCQPGASRLTIGQAKAIGFLAHRGRSTVGDIAEGLGVSMPAASELLDRLVEAGWAERSVDAADRRRASISLTPEATALAARLDDNRRALLRAAFGRLAPEERVVFARCLRALAATLREAASPRAKVTEAVDGPRSATASVEFNAGREKPSR